MAMRNFKFFICLLLTLVATSTLSAQMTEKQSSIEWSAPYSEPPKSYLTKIIHTDSEGFYGLRVQAAGVTAGKADVFVEYYLKDQMQLKMSKTFDLKFKNKTRDFEDVVMLKGNNMYFLTCLLYTSPSPRD